MKKKRALTRREAKRRRLINYQNRKKKISFHQNMINTLLTKEQFIKIILDSIPELELEFSESLDVTMISSMSIFKPFMEAAEIMIEENQKVKSPSNLAELYKKPEDDDEDDEDDEEDDEEVEEDDDFDGEVEDNDISPSNILRGIIENSIRSVRVQKAVEEIQHHILESIRKDLTKMIIKKGQKEKIKDTTIKTKPKTRKTPYLT